MVNEKYKAYTEVLEILKYVPIEKYNMIPDSIINTLMQNYDENYDFVYNAAIPLKNQNISDKAKEILRFIDESFWRKEGNIKTSIGELFPEKHEIAENKEIITFKKQNWLYNIIQKIKNRLSKIKNT